jgi:hypothetical protein
MNELVLADRAADWHTLFAAPVSSNRRIFHITVADRSSFQAWCHSIPAVAHVFSIRSALNVASLHVFSLTLSSVG